MDEARKNLLVDDDGSIRSLCSEALSLHGYSVDTAADGMEALEKLRRSTYGLIISDIDMPGLNGMELYSRVREEFPYLKNNFFLQAAMAGTMFPPLSRVPGKDAFQNHSG